MKTGMIDLGKAVAAALAACLLLGACGTDEPTVPTALRGRWLALYPNTKIYDYKKRPDPTSTDLAPEPRYNALDEWEIGESEVVLRSYQWGALVDEHRMALRSADGSSLSLDGISAYHITEPTVVRAADEGRLEVAFTNSPEDTYTLVPLTWPTGTPAELQPIAGERPSGVGYALEGRGEITDVVGTIHVEEAGFLFASPFINGRATNDSTGDKRVRFFVRNTGSAAVTVKKIEFAHPYLGGYTSRCNESFNAQPWVAPAKYFEVLDESLAYGTERPSLVPFTLEPGEEFGFHPFFHDIQSTQDWSYFGATQQEVAASPTGYLDKAIEVRVYDDQDRRTTFSVRFRIYKERQVVVFSLKKGGMIRLAVRSPDGFVKTFGKDMFSSGGSPDSGSDFGSSYTYVPRMPGNTQLVAFNTFSPSDYVVGTEAQPSNIFAYLSDPRLHPATFASAESNERANDFPAGAQPLSDGAFLQASFDGGKDVDCYSFSLP